MLFLSPMFPPLCFIYLLMTSLYIQTFIQEIYAFPLAFLLLLRTVHPAWKLTVLAGKCVFLLNQICPLFFILMIVQTSFTSHLDYPQRLSASGFARFQSSLHTVVKGPFHNTDITLSTPCLNSHLSPQFN